MVLRIFAIAINFLMNPELNRGLNRTVTSVLYIFCKHSAERKNELNLISPLNFINALQVLKCMLSLIKGLNQSEDRYRVQHKL